MAFDTLSDGDTLIVLEGFVTLAPRTVLRDRLTIWANNITLSSLSAVWLTVPANVSLTFRGTLEVYGTGIVVDGGLVTQEGEVNFRLHDSSSQGAHYTGLALKQGAKWVQNGRLTFSISSDNSTTSLIGVQATDSAVWEQSGSLEMRADGLGSLTAVYLDSGASWRSFSSVSLTVSQSTVIGVVMSDSAWRPTSTVDIVASNGAKGLMISDSVWNQDGRTAITSTNGSIGVHFAGASNTWNQSADLVVSSSEGQARGILIGASSPWTQSGRLNVIAGQSSIGILVKVSETWMQTGMATIVAQGPSAVGLLCDNAILTWQSAWTINTTASQTGTAISGCLLPTPSPSPSASPQILLSNMTTIPTMPMLCFNLSAPAVLILPKDSNGNVQNLAGVMVSLDSVGRVDNNDTLIEEATITDGMWGEESNNSLGASQSYLYACSLSFNSTGSGAKRNGGSANATILQLQWYLFNSTTNVSLGSDDDNGLSFGITPAYTKLTVRMANWPWPTYTGNPSDNGRAQVRIAIDPPFTGSSTPSSGGGGSGGYLKEYGLSGQTTAYTAGSVLTTVRLVDAVEIDGQLIKLDGAGGDTRPPVEYWFDGAKSQLVLSFGRFNSTLIYDPDFGVLVGGRENGGTSSDNTGLIVGVAVAVPLAVVLVVVVIVGAVVLTYYRRRRNVANHVSVNFDKEDAL